MLSSLTQLRHGPRQRGLLCALVVAGQMLVGTPAHAGTLYVRQCQNTPGAAPAFTSFISPRGFVGGAPTSCPNNTTQGADEGIYVFGQKGAAHTQAYWITQAPPGVTITHAWIPDYYDVGIGHGDPWSGGFFWSGGDAEVPGQGQNFSFSSPYFGWQILCGKSGGCSGFGEIGVWYIQLTATENRAPAVVALGGDNLWYHANRYVRGTWPISFSATDPSGVCSMQATVDGQTIVGPASSADAAVWQQCPEPTWNQSINTAAYPNGSIPLTLSARNAASVTASPSETISVDNTEPTIALSGPQDAPTTAGVQHIDAVAATSGPSGIAGISCSLDGAPSQWYPGAHASVAVQGLGDHHVTCAASSNAIDAAGDLGSSAKATWTLSIRQPSVSTLSFARVVDKLRCARTRVRVRVPAHWVTTRWHGHHLTVRVPAQTRAATLVRCHPRVIRRRVRVNGRWQTVRVAVLPHSVRASSRRVANGAATTISGWLGTARGDALGGQTVRIMAAPNNGASAYRQLATARTFANGGWTARVPAGPSRLVRAIYGGASLVEPSTSSQARVVVPASVRLAVTPVDPHWGGTITISGRLLGGYVPPAGEVLFVRLSYGGRKIEVEHVRTDAEGRFRTTYTFLGGVGTAHYPFWVTTAPESDYPFSTASSRKVSVTVSS